VTQLFKLIKTTRKLIKATCISRKETFGEFKRQYAKSIPQAWGSDLGMLLNIFVKKLF